MTHPIEFMATLFMVGILVPPHPSAAQPRLYLGVAGGISTLSADARTIVGSEQVATASYKPENGVTADVYFGLHLNNYLSVQAEYQWNRNALTLDSVIEQRANGNGMFYDQSFSSRQHGAVASALLYFRPRSSWVRPFLSVGTGGMHFSAEPRSADMANGISPPGPFSGANPVLHVAVGIDLKVKSGWGFRYSFGETSSANPISRQLTPPGSRMLANFRNLFGVIKYF